MRTEEENKRAKEVAEDTFAKLFYSITTTEYLSWGVSVRCYGYHNEIPSLMMKVSGLIHKGWVYVCLNEAKDLYEVLLINEKNSIITKKVPDVFFDTLGRTIDELVEKPYDMSDTEYQRRSMLDSEQKILSE